MLHFHHQKISFRLSVCCQIGQHTQYDAGLWRGNLLTEGYRQMDSTNVEVNRQNALAYCLHKDYPMAIKRYQDLTNQETVPCWHVIIWGSAIMPRKNTLKHAIGCLKQNPASPQRQPALLLGTLLLQDFMETRWDWVPESGHRPDYPHRQYNGTSLFRTCGLL